MKHGFFLLMDQHGKRDALRARHHQNASRRVQLDPHRVLIVLWPVYVQNEEAVIIGHAVQWNAHLGSYR